MTDKRPLDESELDGVFRAASAQTPRPSAELMQRIVAEARAPSTAAAPPLRRPAPSRGRFTALIEAIGGWPAATGLAAATVTGLAVGFGTPQMIDTLSGGYLATAGTAYELEDLLPSYGDLLGEG